MSHPVYIEFPDAQVEDSTIWVRSDSVVIIIPRPDDKACTLMLSTNLDAGVEVAVSVHVAMQKINEAIQGTSDNRYYLPIDERMYNAEAT